MNNSLNSKQSALDQAISIQVKIHYWIVVIIIPIGIFLNLISIYIFSKPNLNKTKMGFFYNMLCISNIIVLLYYLFFMDTKITMGYELTLMSDLGCKLITFVRRFLREVPTWIEAFIKFY